MDLNQWQIAFCKWNAMRLKISFSEAVHRFWASWSTFTGGHAGDDYRKFCDQSYEIYRVAFDDSPKEVFEAYKLHGWMHLLRMLSYNAPKWPSAHPIIRSFGHGQYVRIADFGCGLAQSSISLLEALRRSGCDGELFLYDIPTVRSDVLQYIVKEFGLRASFVSCSHDQPIPDLPPCEVIIATEVFEHLHNPVPYLNVMHRALRARGFIVTGLQDHMEEFMHVSPDLSLLNEMLMDWGYEEHFFRSLYQKPHEQPK